MPIQNIKDHEDHLETLLLLMLEDCPTPREETTTQTVGHTIRQYIDQTKMLNFRPTAPGCAYTFDAADKGRLFSPAVNYLSGHVADILGPRTEICMIDRHTIKWSAFVRGTRPRRLVPAGACPVFYEMHHMQGDSRHGWTNYGCRPVGFTRKGRPVIFRVQGLKGVTGLDDAQQAVLAASIKEDAERADAVLAEIECGRSIRFPVGVKAYQDFFRLRDGYRDTPTGQKNPILHWCGQHMRQKRNGESTHVKAHMRGASSIHINGIKLTLTPPESWRCANRSGHAR